LLRAIPFHAQRKQVFLPTALVAEVAVDMGDLFELRPHAALAMAVERLCIPLRAAIEGARSAPSRPLLASRSQAALANIYRRSIEKASYDVFDPTVQRVHAGRQWTLLWAAIRGKI